MVDINFVDWVKTFFDDYYAPKNHLTFDDIYPVGSIYTSTSSTNPHYLFGGYWEQIEDKFLLASGTTYTAGSTGGEANVTLTSSQTGLRAHGHGMAHTHNHRHQQQGQYSSGGGSSSAYTTTASRKANDWYTGYNDTASSKSTTDTSFKIGDNTYTSLNASESHNNMPPYMGVYMWKKSSYIPLLNDITNYYLTDDENNTRISHSAPHEVTYDPTTEYTRIRIYGGSSSGTRYYAIIPFEFKNNFQIDVDLYTTGMSNDDCGVRVCDREALDNDATWKSFGAWIITGQGRLTYGYGGHDTNSTNFLDTGNYSSSIDNNVHLRYTFKFLGTQVYYNIYNLDTNANVIGGTYTRTDSFGNLSGKYYLYIGGGKFSTGSSDKSVYIKNLIIKEI